MIIDETVTITPVFTTGELLVCYSQNPELGRYRRRYGIIDKDDNIIVPFDYDWIGKVKGEFEERFAPEGLLVMRRSQYKGILDSRGSIIIPCEYEDVLLIGEPYSEKNPNPQMCFIVKKNNLYGAIDLNGDVLLPSIYEDYSHEINNKGTITLTNFGGEERITYNITSRVIVNVKSPSVDSFIRGIPIWLIQPEGSNLIIDVKQPTVHHQSCYDIGYEDILYYYRRKKSQLNHLDSFNQWFYFLFIVVTFVLWIWFNIYLSVLIASFSCVVIGGVCKLVIGAFSRRTKKKKTDREMMLEKEAESFFIELFKWKYVWEKANPLYTIYDAFSKRKRELASKQAQ